jgi:hypothetical protein
MAALGKTALKVSFAAAVAAGALGAGQAQALVVTVNNQQWEIKFFDGTQGDPTNAALFQTAANGGSMPWFTNVASSCGTNRNATNFNCLPVQFAQAVGTQLNGARELRFAFSGMTTNSVDPGVTGNACTPPSPNCLRTGQFITINTVTPPGGPDLPVGAAFLDTEPQASSARWAYAHLAPVPGPLPLFGAAAAFGFSRKLRKRINDSKAVGSSFPAA